MANSNAKNFAETMARIVRVPSSAVPKRPTTSAPKPKGK